jgi:hypothetical protein
MHFRRSKPFKLCPRGDLHAKYTDRVVGRGSDLRLSVPHSLGASHSDLNQRELDRYGGDLPGTPVSSRRLLCL